MNSGDIDLRTQGIDQSQVVQLQLTLATFEDGNDPEMAIYDDYFMLYSSKSKNSHMKFCFTNPICS